MTIPTNVKEMIAFRPFWYAAGGLLLLGLILWAYSGDDRKKEIDLNKNIGIAQGENNIVGNLIVNKEKETRNAEINANIARDELNNSLRRDSNQFSGNSTDRFCGKPEFQCDSTCKEWREHRGIICR